MSTFDIVLRIIIAGVLGGAIGIERESINRPAGLRTHILVCMGSTLVMLTSLLLFDRYSALVNIDPTRLGAQVISGIGFLGAGTIMREGLNVKGLTTAASIWIVGCIGLAIGCGFYLGAILATVSSIIVLLFFSKAERLLIKKDNDICLKVITKDQSGQLGKIGTRLGDMNIRIQNISMESSESDHVKINFLAKLPRKIESTEIVESILDIDGIKRAEIV